MHSRSIPQWVLVGTLLGFLVASTTEPPVFAGQGGFTAAGSSAPTVTGITPSSGLNTGNVNITNLAGTKFKSGAAVKLTRTGQPNRVATNVKVPSAKKITCTFNLAGAAAGAWNVVVTNPDGQIGTLTNGFTITRPLAPTVTGITPSSGPNTGSLNITNLAGTGFRAGATVQMTRSGQPNLVGTQVIVVSATKITCTFNLAGAAAGIWNVAVTNSDGQTGILAGGFTITNATGTSVRVPILLYHKVGPTAYDEEWVTPATLWSHLKALKAYGYTPVTLPELMAYRAGISTPPAKPIVITFDDGFENLLTDAYPVLADPEIDFKATGFIITGYVGQTNAWEGTDPVLNYLTWDQIQTLQASGRLDFQSHTVSHPNLVNHPPAALPDQLLDSRQDLETHLGTAVRFIAWPYGAYNTTVAQAAWAAGYQAGVLAAGGIETGSATQRTELKRIEIFATTSVNYDPIHRDNFFMTRIQEPDFPVPAITIRSIQYADPATGQSVTTVRQGNRISVRVTAANTGASAAVVASLQIDDDADPTNGLIYNSHTVNPSQDIARTFTADTQTFQWTITVPASARAGTAWIAVAFHDSHYVLGFALPDWQPGFSITP